MTAVFAMKNTSIFWILFITAIMFSCSAERNNVISKTYHNTTARYNAYFYAKGRIQEVEQIVKESRDNDYNNVLKLYPKIDSTIANTYQTQIDDAIKKASIAIQRHKNSKWVDDSYILIGEARYYSLDFVNAIQTYMFVNGESEDDDARHRALINLLKAYTDYEEYANAVAVSDYLKKEKLNRENAKWLYVNRAHLSQVNGDYDNMVDNLVKAAPLLSKKDGKGRIYFIIGQIYQQLGFDAEAFNNYKKCIASNPEYELDFYARLNMAQVTQLGKSSDVRSARKLFRKLLRDKKNKEFKDRIYFEMAEFEVKQGNLDKAIPFYESSVMASQGNNRQKGHAYLRLGEIYYDSLKKYELAKSYYDSTINVLPTDFENYEKIKIRQEVLADFVTQLNTIELQDSLLALAALDTAEVRQIMLEIVEKEEEEEKKAEEKAQRQASRRRLSSLNNSSGISSTSWYFGNPSAVSIGQSEFKRIWGDRQLADNWRRSNQETFTDFDEETSSQSPEEVAKNGSSDSENKAKDSADKVARLMAEIPFEQDKKNTALSAIEEAYYKLGNIYDFSLEEEENAIVAFETLLQRFPETEYEPEVLYQLYLLLKDMGNEKYKVYENQLVTKFPKTTYARLVVNPNYTEESTAANEQLKKIYKSAYNLFQKEEYSEALIMLDQGLKNYPETVFSPRLELLKILITGKTEDINLYQFQLSEFIENNPDTDVTPYATELLESSRTFVERRQRLLGTEYIKFFEQEHYFLLVYETRSELTDYITSKVDEFNIALNDSSDLKVSNLILNDKFAMILVSSFEEQNAAYDYFLKVREADPVQESKQDSKFYKFVITKDNFNIFYQSKDLEVYQRFFDKNYGNGS